MKNFLITIFLLLTFYFNVTAQWFDQQSLSSTILLEKQEGDSIVPYGTGFTLWNYSNPDYPIVITAGHLIRNKSELFISVNADSSFISYLKKQNADTVILTQNKLRAKLKFFEHPVPSFIVDTTNDVGIFLIDLATTGKSINTGDSIRFADFMVIPRSRIKLHNDVSLGDELYFVGFPFGIGASLKIEPVIRSGSVAWLSESSPEFLLDAFSFGGNSGSPIFSKILFGRKIGEATWQGGFLVGMVVGHLGEKVEGLLLQPDPKLQMIERLSSFETQNWGLARCIWIDEILKIVEKSKNLSLPVTK